MLIFHNAFLALKRISVDLYQRCPKKQPFLVSLGLGTGFALFTSSMTTTKTIKRILTARRSAFLLVVVVLRWAY